MALPETSLAAPSEDGREPRYTSSEMMTVAAARALPNGTVCFVGIGIPSLAANLARHLAAPDLVLVYESGTIGARPSRPPLSIGDGELADTASSVVSVPEIFNYWLQPGRIEVGFLAAAQLDRFGNINTTVVGDYASPRVRLPGAGGASEIACCCKQVIIVMPHSRRGLVERLDFVTSVGYGSGPGDRERLGFPGGGPSMVITDLGVLRPDPGTWEMTLTEVHPGVEAAEAVAATGWELKVDPRLARTAPPTERELSTLRALDSLGW